MTNLVRKQNGFEFGRTTVTEIGESTNDTGMHFSILKLKAGEEISFDDNLETACLLMDGETTFLYDDNDQYAERSSLFDEDPFALHFSAESTARIKAESDCEFAILQTENPTPFDTCFFDANNMLESEHRGKGALDDTAYRIVRTIFDIRNRPDAKLVLGEVISFPGRWSSYPPHHHAQPEIYHYRFTEPQGLGFAQLGKDAYQIRQNDTLKILNEKDHAQTAAPGYGMYYIWVIRHLENNPYTVPTFTQDHDWIMSKEGSNRVWKPVI